MNWLDFPGVTFGQLALTIALLIHFLQVRHRRPIFRPIMTLAVALVMATNYTARIYHLDWFFVADTVMFWSMFAQVAIMIYYTNKEPKPVDIVGSSIWKGFVPRLVVVSMCVLLVMLIHNEVDAYMTSKAVLAREQLEVAKKDLEAKRLLAQEQKKTQAWQKKVFAKQDTIQNLTEQAVMLGATTAHNTNIGLANDKDVLRNQGKALNVLDPKKKQGKVLKGQVKPIEHKTFWQKMNPFSMVLPGVLPVVAVEPAYSPAIMARVRGEGFDEQPEQELHP